MRESIAGCCLSCNASKGTKDLAVWRGSTYRRTRGIAANSAAAVVTAVFAYRNDTDAPGA